MGINRCTDELLSSQVNQNIKKQQQKEAWDKLFVVRNKEKNDTMKNNAVVHE